MKQTCFGHCTATAKMAATMRMVMTDRSRLKASPFWLRQRMGETMAKATAMVTTRMTQAKCSSFAPIGAGA